MLLKKAVNYLPILVFIVGAIILSEILLRVFNVPEWLFPTPLDTVTELFSNILLYLENSAVTLLEIVVGFAFALLFAIIVGSLSHLSKTVYKIIYPFAIVSQIIPIIAIAPLLIIWFGYGFLAKFVVTALLSFFPILIGLLAGLNSVEGDYIKMMKTLKATRWQIYYRLEFPFAILNLYAGIKVGLLGAFIGSVVAEWLAGSSGLGWIMREAYPQLKTAKVFASLLCLSCIAFILFTMLNIFKTTLLSKYFRKI